MKVFRLEFIEWGEYDVVTEAELRRQYTPEKIEEMKKDDMVILSEQPFTPKQLENARKKHNDQDYCDWFEEEFDMAPSLFDILVNLYGGNK